MATTAAPPIMNTRLSGEYAVDPSRFCSPAARWIVPCRRFDPIEGPEPETHWFH